MDTLTAVLIETHRLQVLAYIQRRKFVKSHIPTPWNVATWMRIDIRACADLLNDLVADGFVDPPPREKNWLTCPLALSDIGRGYLQWAETRPMLPLVPRAARQEC